LLDYDSALIIFKTNARIFIFLITYFPTNIYIFATN